MIPNINTAILNPGELRIENRSFRLRIKNRSSDLYRYFAAEPRRHLAHQQAVRRDGRRLWGGSGAAGSSTPEVRPARGAAPAALLFPAFLDLAVF